MLLTLFPSVLSQLLGIYCLAYLPTAIFNLFLPSLLFGSILHTIHFARTEVNEWGSEQLLVPPIWALITLTASATVARIVIFLFVHDVEEAVRRVLFISLLLGNANNLPILLIERYSYFAFLYAAFDEWLLYLRRVI